MIITIVTITIIIMKITIVFITKIIIEIIFIIILILIMTIIETMIIIMYENINVDINLVFLIQGYKVIFKVFFRYSSFGNFDFISINKIIP